MRTRSILVRALSQLGFDLASLDAHPQAARNPLSPVFPIFCAVLARGTSIFLCSCSGDEVAFSRLPASDFRACDSELCPLTSDTGGAVAIELLCGGATETGRLTRTIRCLHRGTFCAVCRSRRSAYLCRLALLASVAFFSRSLDDTKLARAIWYRTCAGRSAATGTCKRGLCYFGFSCD